MGDGNDGERQLLLKETITNYTNDGNSMIGGRDPAGNCVGH